MRAFFKQYLRTTTLSAMPLARAVVMKSSPMTEIMEDRTIRVEPADLKTLTVGELELLEERTGRPLSKLFDDDAPRGILLHALAYIMLRRRDPATTWEGSGDYVVELGEEAVNPTPLAKARARRAG
jgi:hypothetical protein